MKYAFQQVMLKIASTDSKGELTNAEKQQRRRERLKAQGLVHVQGWVTPDQARVINAIIQGKPATYDPEGQTVTYHRPAAPEPDTKPALGG